MSHKQLWNMVVESRLIYPVEHPLHNLDIMVLGAFLFGCVILWVAILEWKFVRWERRQINSYDEWEKAWRKSQSQLSSNLKGGK